MRWARIIVLAATAGLATCSSDSPQGGSGEQPPDVAAEQALQGIREELVRLKPKFAQLADFDAVDVRRGSYGDSGGATRLSLEYSRGRSGDRGVEAPAFAESGCQITVEVVVYDPLKHPGVEERMSLGSRDYRTFELADGIRLAIWDLVLAEKNERGAAFIERVRTLLSSRLMALWMDLDGVAIDPFGD